MPSRSPATGSATLADATAATARAIWAAISGHIAIANARMARRATADAAIYDDEYLILRFHLLR
jgi:hypothetical protein